MKAIESWKVEKFPGTLTMSLIANKQWTHSNGWRKQLNSEFKLEILLPRMPRKSSEIGVRHD